MKLSPSELERAAACPGSVAAQKDMPWSDSDWAEEGKLLHAVMAGASSESLDREQRHVIRTCGEHGGSLVAIHLGSADEYLREWRVACAIDKTKLSGIMDFAAWKRVPVGSSVIVIDWKFGREPVEYADSNLQLRAYAVLAARNVKDTARVVVAVVQPRAEVERQVTECEYLPDDLKAAEEQISLIAEICADPNAARIPGDHCKYCRASGTPRCPESTAQLVQVQPDPLLQLPVGNELSSLLGRCEAAEAVIKRLREHAEQEIAAGRVVPGWEMTPNAPWRTVPDVAAAWEKLQDFLEPTDFMRLCKVSVTDLQNAVAEKDGLSQVRAKARLSELLGPAIVMQDRRSSLKRADRKVEAA